MSADRISRLPAISPAFAHALGAGILLGCLALSGCKGGGDAEAKDGEKKAQDAVPVEAVKVVRRPIAASYSGTAPLEARAESQVVAKTSGVALQVMAEVGQEVRAGQVLVRIALDGDKGVAQERMFTRELGRIRDVRQGL